MMVKDLCCFGMYDFTIKVYEIWNSQGVRGGNFLALDRV